MGLDNKDWFLKVQEDINTDVILKTCFWFSFTNVRVGPLFFLLDLSVYVNEPDDDMTSDWRTA